MKSIVRLSMLSAAFLAGTFTTKAQVTNPLQLAKGFDVFTKTGLTFERGHTDGPVATGGDLTLNGETTIAMNNSGAYPFAYNNGSNYGIVINGRINYTTGNVSYVNQGHMRISNITGTTLFDKDNNNASTNLQAVSSSRGFNSNPRLQLQRQQDKTTVTTAHNIDFNTAFNQFVYNTDLIKSYPANTPCASSFNFITIPSGQNPRINLVSGKVNYINLTQTQLTNLNNQGSITFTTAPAADKILIVNVTLDNGVYTWTPPNMAGVGDAAAPYVLYNFHNATSLTIGNGNNSVYGTVYAPRADVYKTGGNNNNGQIVANSFTMAYGEVHSYPFKGAFPDCGGTTIINNYNNSRTGQPLPIKDILLTVTTGNYGSFLNWKVTQEQDVLNYSVEKSADAKSFNTIQTITTKGDALENNYSTEDNEINTKETYYRVKVNFTNGTFVYSNIVKLSTTVNANSSSAYPNPFHNAVNVRLNVTGNVQVKLTDIAGRVISDMTITNREGDVINIPVQESLNNGMYFLQVLDANKSVILTKTLVKN
jgi:choice-of-anchor A domain-containing protein